MYVYSFAMQLVCRNGSPYLFKVSDSFKCRIVSIAGKAEIPHVVEPASLVDQSVIRVSFTAKVSGLYRLSLMLNNSPISSGEIFRKYLPGLCMCVCVCLCVYVYVCVCTCMRACV